jgi:hypothetical protein
LIGLRKSRQVAKRRLATSVGRREDTSTARYSGRVRSLLSQRDRLMNEIVALRSVATAPAPFLDKADQLLTVFWGKATWQSREEILRSAQWLLTIGNKSVVLRAAGPSGRRKHANGAPRGARARLPAEAT